MSPDRPAFRREIEDSTAARLAEILAAAERAARQVIDDAEGEARTRLSDAHEEADRIVAERLAGLTELTAEIDAQAEALRRQAEALRRALAEAKAQLEGAAPTGPLVATVRRRFDPGAVPEQDGGRPPGPALSIVGAPQEEDADGVAPAGARLLATQMAVSGSSRAEIEARLRGGFAIEDTGAILDAILGPEQ